MAIEGHYRDDNPPAPYVYGEVYLPDLHLHTGVAFLVDTGAHATSLMPDDAAEMGLDIRNLGGRYQRVEGVGGEARYKTTRAVLRFQDHDAFGHFQEFEIDIHLTRGHAWQQLPSLLGRDILNECECILDGVRERVAIRRLAGGG
ncbi:MAG: aspartyl protease family protein [Chloroflexota bacterium]|nr:aspartyl protease family protein [Chloroflexota bacterium]MDE2885077.1 aspartyl protease family protein [Chloroflexota bacterium]